MNNRFLAITWAAVSAFATYSCMYAYRKPLSAGTFEPYTLWGVSYKVILITMQVLGYLTAKCIGIKVISEMIRRKRRLYLLSLIGVSQFSLLLFAVTPYPYNFPWIFFNGLPLGLIWGIVFTYIEGRRATDILATFMSISFVISSGLVKSIGRTLIETSHIPEFWMPFAVGCLFIPLVLLSSWMLEKIPPPDTADKKSRSVRIPMDGLQRKTLFNTYSLGLCLIIFVNIVLTIARDIKDNFLVEIFRSLDLSGEASVYARTETIVGLIVLVFLSLIVLIKKNENAFFLIHLIMILGLIVMLASTWMYAEDIIKPFSWVVLHGVGLYTSYIVFQSLYFERFIATYRINGNVGFLIYLADFMGYIGSVLILCGKEFLHFEANWNVFFVYVSYAVGITGIAATVLAYAYFSTKSRRHE